MASYRRTVTVSKTVAQTFAYVSDFRHTATWDPLVVSARLAGDAPIGVGSRFVVASRLGPTTQDLPYEITEFERDQRLVLRGEVWFMRYVDTITFAASAGGGTALTYVADADLIGVAALGNALLPCVFDRIGNKALEGIRRAVEAHA